MRFAGFPPEAFEFYEQLGADNTKVFWHEHKATFETCIKAPMAALGEQLADYGPFHVFRPYNDLRFAKGRPPYKTAQGAYAESEGGTGHYLHVSAEGMMAAAGYYSMAKDQLERFRAAVADDGTGPEVERLAAELAGSGYAIGAMEELKSAPRGYPKDHPRITLLRRKGLMMSRSWPVAAWMHTAKAEARVREVWDAAAPLCDWLDAHVGPSTLPPDDAFGAR